MDTKNEQPAVRAIPVSEESSPGRHVDAVRDHWAGVARSDGTLPIVMRDGRHDLWPTRRTSIGPDWTHLDLDTRARAGEQAIASMHAIAAITDEVCEITFAGLSRALDGNDPEPSTSFRVDSMPSGTLHKWTGLQWVKVIGGSAVLRRSEKLQWVGARSPFVVTRLGAASILSRPHAYVVLFGEEGEDDEHVEVLSGGEDSQRSLVAGALVQAQEELRLLSHRMVSVHEEQRKRIALDLQDGLGRSLREIRLCIEDSGKLLAAGATGAAGESLHQLLPRVGEVLAEVRRISSELRPPILDHRGILATLAWFCRQVQSLAFGVTVEAELALKEREVPSRLHITILRIVQEAFHDILKHGQASHVRVKLHRVDATVHLMIEDDGIGFDPDTVTWTDVARRGLGLLGMKERARVSGGTYHLRSAHGEGTCIWASWACHLPE